MHVASFFGKFLLSKETAIYRKNKVNQYFYDYGIH